MAGAPGRREVQGAAGRGHPAARPEPRRRLSLPPSSRAAAPGSSPSASPPHTQRPPGPGPQRSGRSRWVPARARVAGARGSARACEPAWGRSRPGARAGARAVGGGRGAGAGPAPRSSAPFPLCPRPSPPRHKDPGPPGEGRVTEPPAGGVAATPPRAHPQRPRRQLRPRPRPATPPGLLLFLRRGGGRAGGAHLSAAGWASRCRGDPVGRVSLTDVVAALCERF